MTPEVYRPSESERGRGKWAVVCESVDKYGDPDWKLPVHIMPTFGVHHQIHESCWCEPIKEVKDGYIQFIHKASQ